MVRDYRRFEPTYKELKLEAGGAKNPEAVAGFEPTYKELKLD